MSTNYPGSADDNTTLPNPSSSNPTNSPSLSSAQSNQNDAIKAIEAKLGTGASTPSNNTFLIGNGSGTSTYSSLTSAQLAARITDETGTGSAVFASSPTLVTPNVNTINEATAANGVTIDGLNLKDGALNTSNSVVTSNITDSAVTAPKVAVGFPVQMVTTNYSAVATGTTTIPQDDTIPQITEGTEFMTQAITPKSATNILVIEAVAFISVSNANDRTMALFQDATANALAVSNVYMLTAAQMVSQPLSHTMVAGTTSSTTFRVRIGPSLAGTVSFNGTGGSRYFGATTKSFIKITEYKA